MSIAEPLLTALKKAFEFDCTELMHILNCIFTALPK